jgi:mannose-6-phosphate isomerase-like protein (cupin superfamily)
VLSGSGRVKLDDEIVEVSRLDAIRVAPSVGAPSRPARRDSS